MDYRNSELEMPDCPMLNLFAWEILFKQFTIEGSSVESNQWFIVLTK